MISKEIQGDTLDQIILNSIKGRDEAGLELLYDNYSASLYGIANSVLHHRSAAEDAVQISFLKIWNSVEQYDAGKSTLFTWMARIVRNSSTDIARLKSFQRESRSLELTTATKCSTLSKGTDVFDAAKILSLLDSKYEEVLDFLYLRGYTQSEYADEFDIPLGTVKTRARKALINIRDILGKEVSQHLLTA